ncbi:response regulator [Acidobacteriota bacterium]
MSNKKVLVIDDEDFIRELVKDFLDLKDIHCDAAEDANIALKLYSETDYDLVLLDVNLGNSTAVEVLAKLKKVRTDTPILLLTGDPRYNEGFSDKIGANGVIFKPFQVDNFIKNIEEILER